MRNPDYDLIVIGQGLAGSILAYKLIKRGLRVLVVDNNHHHSASKVAAGIINPISGPRLSLNEGYEGHFNSAIDFYSELQKSTNRQLFRRIPQYRLLTKQSQFDYLQRRRQQKHYQTYIGNLDTSVNNYPGAAFGVIPIQHTAVVDSKSLLTEIQAYLIKNNSYLCHQVDYDSIVTSANGAGKNSDMNGFEIADKTARALIFCEGYQANNNPWLKHLPFKLAKGEVFNISLATQKSGTLLNWGNWLLPNADHSTAKLGATFEWHDLNHQPNLESQNKLSNDLTRITDIECSIESSEVGIRPATVSRIPFIGEISTLPKAYCFNGFGSKGCLLIPYYADLLCEHLMSQQRLPQALTKWL